MKLRHLITVLAVLSVSLSDTSWSIEYPSVRNPMGSGTVPPSSLKSGLYRSPSRIDNSGNLLITGNVRGGRHFRGTVPYQSGTSFGAPLGSTSLDSFLRDSAGLGDSGRYRSGYSAQPYYSRTGTVTTLIPGRPGILTPASPRVSGRVREFYGSEVKPNRSASVPSQSRLERLLRTERLTAREIERLLERDLHTRPGGDGITAERYVDEIELLRRELRSTRGGQTETQKSLTSEDDRLKAAWRAERGDRAKERPEMPQSQEDLRAIISSVGKTAQQRAQKSDVLEQIKIRLESLQKGAMQMPSAQETQASAEAEQEIEQAQEAKQDESYLDVLSVRDTRSSLEEKNYEWTGWRATTPAADDEQDATGGRLSPLDEIDSLSDDELHSEAKRILGSYQDFASFSESKFNQHVAAAETYLKQGLYYRASDSYGLALIYKAGNVRVNAGKGHALFAAGEYMSSALFLSRALEASPDYARSEVDLSGLLGIDNIESRIADVNEWLQKSKAPELEFLLGYIYYRIGRLQAAEDALASASAKMPSSAAVTAVKKAVEQERRSSKSK